MTLDVSRAVNRITDPNSGYRQLIEQRTFGRVRNLSVEVVVDASTQRVVIGGNTGSYYLKQLAQEGIRDLAHGLGLEIVNNIEVK